MGEQYYCTLFYCDISFHGHLAVQKVSAFIHANIQITYTISFGRGDKKSMEEMTKEEMQRFLIKEAQRGSTEMEAYRNLMEILGIEFPIEDKNRKTNSIF